MTPCKQGLATCEQHFMSGTVCLHQSKGNHGQGRQHSSITALQLQVVTVRKRYEVGLEKLATTESSVADMQQELIALQPQLEVSTKETEAAMVVSPPTCSCTIHIVSFLCCKSGHTSSC